MQLHPKSVWNDAQITDFLEHTEVPLRLSFLNKSGEPQICSLWYLYDNGVLWTASHNKSFLVQQLKASPEVAFEVSTNDYPYKGVRGKATTALSMQDADAVLKKLIHRYLGNSNAPLANWLLSRSADEYAIKIQPQRVNAWDFSNRMQKTDA